MTFIERKKKIDHKEQIKVIVKKWTAANSTTSSMENSYYNENTRIFLSPCEFNLERHHRFKAG